MHPQFDLSHPESFAGQGCFFLYDFIYFETGDLSEVRRLVYDLRPPALDELGLLEAVREYVAQNGVNGLQISLDAPEHLPSLSAAVEVAAYRIIQEAVTNVIRHARARMCQVSLSLTDEPAALHLGICDDGLGLSAGYHAGVGLGSMRERAQELGGECVIETGASGGVRVSACLPLLKEYLIEQITVLIADDHAEFREGLAALLETANDLELVGEASTGDEAVALAARLQPDVILMDINMHGLNGIEAPRRILHGSPHIAILILTMFEDDDSVFAAVRAGAQGYILKGALKAEIFRAIRALSHGEAIFGPAIARKLMNYFAAPRPSAPPQTFPELTDREREILALMAQHLTNPEIAERLSISQKTIRNQVSNILSKLQVTDRAQAIIRPEKQD